MLILKSLLHKQLVYGGVDFSLEQAPLVGGNFGTFTSFTYYLFFTFMEQKPKLLPLYLNIAHPLDYQTWILILTSLISVWLLLTKIYHMFDQDKAQVRVSSN